MFMPIHVVEEDGETNVKEVKGGSNTFFRLAKGASSTKLDSRGGKTHITM